jgi:hypothetical protein
MKWPIEAFNYKYKKCPKKVREYIVNLLGKEEARKLFRAIRSDKWIIISGPECSGKTLLWDILRTIGYPYVLEEHMTTAIHTSEPLKELRDWRSIYESLEIPVTR